MDHIACPSQELGIYKNPQILGGMSPQKARLYCLVVIEHPQPALSVIVIEDDPIAREAIVRAIHFDRRMRLAAQAATLAEGLEALKIPHDVIVVDLGLPDGSGAEILRQSVNSGVGHRLVLTMFGDEQSVVGAIAAGADGYILKDDENVVDAIAQVADGHVPLTPAVAVHLVRRLRSTADQPSDLTPREHDILMCLARGMSYRDAAKDLNISYHTVTDHVKALYRKLSVNSRSSAVFTGLRSGLISLHDKP